MQITKVKQGTKYTFYINTQQEEEQEEKEKEEEKDKTQKDTQIAYMNIFINMIQSQITE